MSLGEVELARGAQRRHLAEIAADGFTLLVLLRHSGCPLCREHLVVTDGLLDSISDRCQVIGVCQGDGEEALALEQELELGFPVFADPAASLYRQLELPRGSWWQVTLGPMLRQPVKALSRMKEVRRPGRDVRQLGGVVLLSEELTPLYRYAQRDSGDLPGDDEVLAAIDTFCGATA